MRFWQVCLLLVFRPMTIFSQDLKFTPENSAILSKHVGKQVLRQMSRCVALPGNKFFDISVVEKEQMERQMKALYNMTDAECYNRIKHRLDNLSRYYYQYVGVIYKGKRYIYINAFDAHYVDAYWRTEPFVMGDGGLSFWGVYFDLSDNIFRYLAFNMSYRGEIKDSVRTN